MAACFDHVPVVEVCTDNFTEVWPFMMQAIKKSSFVAVDTELSGIGDRKQIMAQSVEDRYKYMCEVAQSRSILSLGISCFKQKKAKTSNDSNSDQSQRKVDGSLRLKVQTFNIIVLCTETFVVEPASLKFLVEHGFDFNKQYAKGVSYTRGTDKVQSKPVECSVCNLFAHLVLANKPLVLHNGLFDLIFLYQNFYCKLPDNLHVFTADLSEMFPAGIFDTKYVSEYCIREPASYLIYLFRKSQRNNILHQKLGEKHVALKFPEEASLLLEWTEELYCKANVDCGAAQRDVAVCEKYAAYGFCPQENRCCLSHDVDDVLDRERRVKEHKRQKRKRKFQSSSGNCEPAVSESCVHNTTTSEEKSQDRSARDVHVSQDDAHAKPPDKVKTRDCGHRAGFDAFMTGYCMATYLLQLSNQRDNKEFSLSSLVDISNKVSLTKKEVPLQITRSHFIRPSALHSEKLKEIKEAFTSC